MISGILEDGNYTYEFKYDEDEYLKFRKEVIDNASRITHVSSTGINGPYDKRHNNIPYEIRNCEIKDYGRDRYGRKQYNFIYDKYEYPYLIKLMDDFNSGNIDALFDIMFPNFTLEYSPAYDRLKNEIEELKSINDRNINEMIEKVNDIKSLLLDINEGKIFIPALKYYNGFLNFINLKVKNIELKKENK